MSIKICVLDYGCGNIQSVINIINHIGYDCSVINSINDQNDYDLYILPGVGSFDNAMNNLKKSSIFEFLIDFPKDKFLIGICLGMQLLCKRSEEGFEEGLGLIDADVRKFDSNKTLVPNMGWREVVFNDDFLNEFNLDNKQKFYFVHSYYVSLNDKSNNLGTTSYSIDFTSAFNKENLYGFQFHPEKSHQFGINLLKNIIEKCNDKKNNSSSYY